ncbi:MAG: lipid-A-disaccharide synthase [Alphaproteobacteria bacterium]|nr:lipid-A-disaccharide synthase [Alphaproteobacteria bacterium]
MPRIMIMAGEASGDILGAGLARDLRALDPEVSLHGLGGARMEAAGVQLLQGIERLDIIGIPSWSELKRAISTYRSLSQRLREMDLDAVILIDNPGLNLRLARTAKKAGHRVVYYAAPQIWAWRQSRIKTMQRYLDLVLVILPFEKSFYENAGVACQFVGHPMMDDLAGSFDREELRRKHEIEGEANVVGLFPGSRKGEIRSLLPTMLAACRRLSEDAGNQPLRFVLGQAASVPDALIGEIVSEAGIEVTIVRDRSFDVMALSDAAIVASGTATLQTALIGTPMVIVYRASWLTAQIAKRLIKVPFLGLANIVAGRKIANEFLQEDFLPEPLAGEVQRLIGDPQAMEAAKSAAVELREVMGPAGASKRAAQAILDECCRTRERGSR